MKILLHPDKIKINGPKVDNSYTIAFDIGEYERELIAQLVALPIDAEIVLEVEVNDN